MNRPGGRVFAIDIVRGSAAFFLASVHVIWMYGNKELQYESVFGAVVHTAGQATSVFLIAMGFSLMVTRHQAIAYVMRRALIILCAGYMLNTLKFIVPISLFGSMPESFVEAYGWTSPLNKDQLLYLFLTGDIFQLAGISFIIAGIVRRYIRNQYLLLGCAILSICLYPFLKGYQPKVQGLDYIANLMWGETFNVYFPVLPWISNIFVGMFLGRYYLNQDSVESSVFRGAGLVGLPALILGGTLCYRDWDFHFNDFFHPGPGGAFLVLGASLCTLYLYGKILTKYLHRYNNFRRIVTYLSTRVTSIYIIQWTIICWGMGIFGYHTLNFQEIILLLPLVTALTLLVDYGVLLIQIHYSSISKRIINRMKLVGVKLPIKFITSNTRQD